METCISVRGGTVISLAGCTPFIFWIKSNAFEFLFVCFNSRRETRLFYKCDHCIAHCGRKYGVFTKFPIRKERSLVIMAEHGAYGGWSGSALCRTTPTATRGLGFCGLARRIVPLSRFTQHARGSEGLFQLSNEDLFQPSSEDLF